MKNTIGALVTVAAIEEMTESRISILNAFILSRNGEKNKIPERDVKLNIVCTSSA